MYEIVFLKEETSYIIIYFCCFDKLRFMGPIIMCVALQEH